LIPCALVLAACEPPRQHDTAPRYSFCWQFPFAGPGARARTFRRARGGPPANRQLGELGAGRLTQARSSSSPQTGRCMSCKPRLTGACSAAPARRGRSVCTPSQPGPTPGPGLCAKARKAYSQSSSGPRQGARVIQRSHRHGFRFFLCRTRTRASYARQDGRVTWSLFALRCPLLPSDTATIQHPAPETVSGLPCAAAWLHGMGAGCARTRGS
jgi:hypothetical protein